MSKLKNIFKKVFHEFENALFPENLCIVCGREKHSDATGMCRRCDQDIFRIDGHVCDKCGMPITDEHYLCEDCVDHMHLFTKARAAFMYDDLSSKMIWNLKYSGKAFLAKYLAREMVAKLPEMSDSYDLIIPVPLHANREKFRGFNQSKLLAVEISEMTSIAINAELLIRTRETETQTGKSKAERQGNLSGAFEVTDGSLIKNKIVLLVDDVYTTGTTLNECTKTILKHKPKAVYVITALKTHSPK